MEAQHPVIHWYLPPVEEPATRTYREDLAAAHARIAALEERVRTLTEAAADPELHALERNRRRAARDASGPGIRRVIAISSLFPVILFCAPGLVVVISSPDLHAHVFPVMGLCVGVVLGAMAWLITPRTARRALDQAEAELAAAIRIRDLERLLREAKQEEGPP